MLLNVMVFIGVKQFLQVYNVYSRVGCIKIVEARPTQK